MRECFTSWWFLLLWAGQLVSSLGSRLSSFALGLWVLHATGSTTQFAVTFIVTTIPVVIGSPFAGALADRWDRRSMMMVCDVVAGVSLIALAGLSAMGRLAVWHIYIAAAANAVLDCFRSPAFSASIPLLVKPKQLPRANGMVQTGNAAAAIIGPLLAGALVSSISMHGVLMVDAITFGAGVATLILVRIPRSLPSHSSTTSPGFWQEAASGWRYIRQRAGLLGLLGVYASNHFVFGIASVLIAPLLLSFSSPAMVGIQYAISGCGLLMGGLVMTARGGLEKLVNGVLVGSLLSGLGLAAHGLWPSFALVAGTGFALFLMLPVIEASNTSLWQRSVPPHLQGRCFAVQQLFLNVAMGTGYFLAGPLADRVFGPWLNRGGLLSNSVGAVIGVGPGRGIGLMFIVLGTFMSMVALSAYAVPAIRNIDDFGDDTGLPVSTGDSVPSLRLTLPEAQPEMSVEPFKRFADSV